MAKNLTEKSQAKARKFLGDLSGVSFDRCFSIRQVVAHELAARDDVPRHDAYHRISVLADWAETTGGDEVSESLRAAIATICPNCGSAGQEATYGCCGGRAEAA